MSIYDEINNLRQELEVKEKLLKELESQHYDINGIWEVTTEGDCEGRSTQRLGRHRGNLFEIAKQLSSQCYYALHFKRVGYLDKNKSEENKKREVNFSVEDKCIRQFDKQDQLSKLMPSLPEHHQLSEGRYYGSVKLEW